MAEAFRWRRRAATAVMGTAAAAVFALPPATSAQESSFVYGSGKVRSSLFEAVPRTGGLTIPYSGGKSFATYQGRRAEATATVFKPPSEPPGPPAAAMPPAATPGALTPGDTAPARAEPAAECGDKAPGGGDREPGAPNTASPFTFNLTVNSDEENSEAGKREVFAASPDGSPIQGAMAEQEVFATEEPTGWARSTQGRMGIEGVFEIVGGRTEAVAGVVEGKTRRAAGVVEAQTISLLDGLVVIEGARWEAVQRSGADTGGEGAFSIGRAIIAGTPYAPPGPGDSQDAFFQAVNDALAPTGLIIDPPRVANSERSAEITPMSLRLSDSPIGRATVGPLVGAAQPIRDVLSEAALGYSCDLGLVLTVGDVVLSGTSGSGGVAFNFGGISASTDGRAFENPFGEGFGDEPPGGFGQVPPAADSSAGLPATDLPQAGPTVPPAFTPLPSVSDSTPGFPAFEATPPPPLPTAGTDPGAGEELAAPDYAPQAQPSLGSSVTRTAGHKGGAALVVGIIGLLAVGLLVAGDAFHIRKASA